MSFSSDVAITEPEVLYNKTNWRWDKTIADFSAATYTLEYELIQQISSNPHKITLTATASGEVFEIDFDSAAAETQLEPEDIDNYNYQAYLILIADTDDRTFYRKGVFNIKQRTDLETGDPRSHAEIMLDAINAFIEGRANVQDKKKKINDRELEMYSINDLEDWKQRYENQIEAEAIEDDICAGDSVPMPKIKTIYLGLGAQ